MVLIISSFGATNKYPNKILMEKTLHAFLDSLDRQTDKNFVLFISCHDVPHLHKQYDFIKWCSVSSDMDKTNVPSKYPTSLVEPITYYSVSYGTTLTDMSRKTYHSVMQAGKWAYQSNLNDFWMLRMDSDDLLARDMVERLNFLNPIRTQAVFNKKCHIFDVRSKQIGEQHLPYSSTCNAIHMTIENNELPLWYYHCHDHTKFASMVRDDGIPYQEWDWTLCILTNTGNHLSNRASIESHENSKVIELKDVLVDRYGLQSLL